MGGNTPTIADSYSGLLLVISSGRSLWDDLKKFEETFKRPYDTMGVNFAGMFFPFPLTHWATLHGEYFDWWVTMRKEMYHSQEVQTHTNTLMSRRKPTMAKNVWHMPNVGGTSGMFAIKVGLALGYDKVVLCGLPADGSGHFYLQDAGNTTFGSNGQIEEWANAEEIILKGESRVCPAILSAG